MTPRAGRCRRHDESGSRHGHREHPLEDATAQVYSQSLISNSGCCLRCRSLIFSSRYLAPMPFSKVQIRAALVVALVRALAAEEGDELVLADLQIAEIQAMDAALEQGFDLARRVEIVDDLFLSIFSCTESSAKKSPTSMDRNTATCVLAGIQQLFLEYEQVAIQIDDVFLQSLHFRVETAGVDGIGRRSGAIRCHRFRCRRRRGGGVRGRRRSSVLAGGRLGGSGRHCSARDRRGSGRRRGARDRRLCGGVLRQCRTSGGEQPAEHGRSDEAPGHGPIRPRARGQRPARPRARDQRAEPTSPPGPMTTDDSRRREA